MMVVAAEVKKSILVGAVPRRERDDLVSEVMIELVKAWPGFNPARGNAEAFINRVVQSRLISIFRFRAAIKRGRYARHAESLPHDLVDSGAAHRDSQQDLDIRLDLEDMRARLTPEQQSIWDELRHHSVSRISQRRSIPRRTLRDFVARIREAAHDRGLEYYTR